MLNLFLKSKQDAEAKAPQRRPHVASEVGDVALCEYWRRKVINEITREIASIQNPSLGEHKIRDINDKINKLLRERKSWERQIKALGGPDYELTAAKVVDHDGKKALSAGHDGYFYFGAAKDLPGVRELFEKREPEVEKKTRGDLNKLVDAEYYGFKDEDDGLLVKLEAEKEKQVRAEAIREWHAKEQEAKQAQLKALGMDDDERGT